MQKFFLVAAICFSILPNMRALADTNDYWAPTYQPGDERGKMKTLDQIEPRRAILSLPFRISEPGSYYLTGSMTDPAGSNGIEIACDDVKLDLNGFSINGMSSSLHGITIVTSQCNNVTIRNGIIRKWGKFGISASNAHECVIEDIKVFMCGYGGIYVGDNGLLRGCMAYYNGYDAPTSNPTMDNGIKTGSYCTISDCKSRRNKGAGIYSGRHSRVSSCTSTENSADGIRSLDYSTIRDCTVAQNTRNGITISNKCRVDDNMCGENGRASPDFYGAGLRVEGSDNRIENNSVVDNFFGIRMDSDPAIHGNLVVRNSAGGNSMSYKMDGGGDHYGDILQANSIGSSFTNSNPWSNFDL